MAATNSPIWWDGITLSGPAAARSPISPRECFLERFGIQSLFKLPLLLLSAPFALVIVVTRVSKREKRFSAPPLASGNHRPPDAKRFLHMAWLANPLSYVAINTLIPLIPSISSKLGLTTAMAGITCSLWMFARLGAFVLLRRWTGWHYRFGWLAWAFGVMAVCFTVLISSPTIMLFVCAEIGFGFSIGLIYYSSLYYSMNASASQGAHGSLHEAIIGAGLFIGTACGAAIFFPAVGR